MRRDTHLSDWATHTSTINLTIVLLYIQHRLDLFIHHLMSKKQNKAKNNVIGCKLYFKLICVNFGWHFHGLTLPMRVDVDRLIFLFILNSDQFTHWWWWLWLQQSIEKVLIDQLFFFFMLTTYKIKTFRAICLFESEYISVIISIQYSYIASMRVCLCK